MSVAQSSMRAKVLETECAFKESNLTNVGLEVDCQIQIRRSLLNQMEIKLKSLIYFISQQTINLIFNILLHLTLPLLKGAAWPCACRQHLVRRSALSSPCRLRAGAGLEEGRRLARDTQLSSPCRQWPRCSGCLSSST